MKEAQERSSRLSMRFLTKGVIIGVIVIAVAVGAISIATYFLYNAHQDPKENAIECAKQIIWDNIENTSSITFPWKKNKWDVSQTGDTFHAIVDFDTMTFYDAPSKKTASVYFTVVGKDEESGWRYSVDKVSIVDMKKLQGARPAEPATNSEVVKASTEAKPKAKNDKGKFQTVKKAVEQAISGMNLDKNEAVKSWRTQADKEIFYLEIILDEQIYRGIYQGQNNQEIRQVWRKFKNSLKDFTKSARESFQAYGFDTGVIVEVLNPFNTNKALLSITDGVVLYDMMGE